MPWWAIVITVIGSLFFLYVLFGFTITWVFLRGKMRDEKTVRESERESTVPDVVFTTPFEFVTLKNSRGLTVSARVYKAQIPSDKWMLIMHGYNSNGISMVKYGRMFSSFGYNVVSPDFCHCGRSEGKYVSFGWYEKQDAELWLDYMKKQYSPSQIGVFGVSMGAATAVHLVADRDDIAFLIPYCPYESYRRIVVSKGKDLLHIPFFDIFWPVVRATTYVIAGGTRGEMLDVAKDLGKVKCPVLLMHSKMDNFTDYRNSVDLYEKNKDKTNVRLHLFEKGLHARAYVTNPEEYTRVVKEFIDGVNGSDAEKTIA